MTIKLREDAHTLATYLVAESLGVVTVLDVLGFLRDLDYPRAQQDDARRVLQDIVAEGWFKSTGRSENRFPVFIAADRTVKDAMDGPDGGFMVEDEYFTTDRVDDPEGAQREFERYCAMTLPRGSHFEPDGAKQRLVYDYDRPGWDVWRRGLQS